MIKTGSIVDILCVYLLFQETRGLPILMLREPRNEIRYNNGTVVGTYTYKDAGGNPISVKYYADVSGYGVELNSFKTLKLAESTTQNLIKSPKSTAKYEFDLKPVKPLLELASEIMNFDNKLHPYGPKSASKKETGFIEHFDNLTKFTKKATPDYETFYQNEVKAPKQCEKDRVRVYLAKEKRKTKTAQEDAVTHCD